jgi:hypothetical protein
MEEKDITWEEFESKMNELVDEIKKLIDEKEDKK